MPIKIPEVQNINTDVGASSLRLSLGVAQQQANALGGLAAPIGAAGDMLFSMAQKIQEADNLKNISEAELSFDEQSAKYIAGLQGDYNEDTWVPGATEMTKNMRKVFDEQNLSPSAKQRLGAKLDRKESALLLRVGSLAAQQITERANEASLLGMEVAAEAGDQFSYDEIVDGRVTAGISSPEEADTLKREGGKKIRTAELMGLAGNAPHEDLKQEIKAGDWDDVSESARSQALYKSKVADNELKREFYDDLNFAMTQNPPEVPSHDQVMTWIDSGQMSKRDATGLLKRINATSPIEFNAPEFQAIVSEIGDYVPGSDDEAKEHLTTLSKRIALSEFSSEKKSRLITKLISAMEGGNQKASGRVQTAARDRIEHYSDQGDYGLEWDDEGNLTPESIIKDGNAKAILYDQLDAWFEENPEAGFEDGVKAADQIVTGTAELAGAKSLSVSQFHEVAKEDGGDGDGLPQFELGKGALNSPLLGLPIWHDLNTE